MVLRIDCKSCMRGSIPPYLFQHYLIQQFKNYNLIARCKHETVKPYFL